MGDDENLNFAGPTIDDIRHGGLGIGALERPTLEQLTEAIKVAGGRGRFGDFALQSMPANALYNWAFEGGGKADPKFAE